MTGQPLTTMTPKLTQGESRDDAIRQAATAYIAALERRKGHRAEA